MDLPRDQDMTSTTMVFWRPEEVKSGSPSRADTMMSAGRNPAEFLTLRIVWSKKKKKEYLEAQPCVYPGVVPVRQTSPENQHNLIRFNKQMTQK